jgi:predicted metalloprotease
VLLAVGCGQGRSADAPAPTAASHEPVPTAPPADATGVTKRSGERLIAIPSARPSGLPEELPGDGAAGSFEGIDFEVYDATLQYIAFLVDGYWSEHFPSGEGGRYRPPGRVIAYYPLTGAPRCAGRPEGPGNADYCAGRDFVGFDEPGFMIPFYQQIGPVANATIIAHEWGHVIQTRLGLDFDKTVEKELNADCLAGVWTADAVERGLIAGADLKEARQQLIKVGDSPGVPWQAPNAHGTGAQREKAFALGDQGGADACLTELRPGFSRGRPGVVP